MATQNKGLNNSDAIVNPTSTIKDNDLNNSATIDKRPSIITRFKQAILEAQLAIEDQNSSNANGIIKILEEVKKDLEADDAKSYTLRPKDPFSHVNPPAIPKQALLMDLEQNIRNMSKLAKPFPRRT